MSGRFSDTTCIQLQYLVLKPGRSRYIQHACFTIGKGPVVLLLLETTQNEPEWGNTQNGIHGFGNRRKRVCYMDLIERTFCNFWGADRKDYTHHPSITNCFFFSKAGQRGRFTCTFEESPLADWDWLDRRAARSTPLQEFEALLRTVGGRFYLLPTAFRFRCFWEEDQLYPIDEILCIGRSDDIG